MCSFKPVRILYMEDDPGLARLFKRSLESAGNLVDISSDGDQGLDMFEKGSYDILVLDQKMPGKSGIEVIRELSERGNLPPTIMLTGAGNETVAVEAMKLGASDYIIKDVEARYLELMSSVVERVLRHHALVAAKQEAEEELQKAHAELERRVEMRTAELVVANEKLRLEITERKKAEESLRESEERMRMVIESSPIGIQIAQDGKYHYVNPAFVSMFGYEDPSEIVGLPVEELYVSPDRDTVIEKERAGAAGGRNGRRFDVRGLRKNGRSFEVSLWPAPFNLRQRPSTLGFVIDVSEEKTLRAQLLQAQKMEAIGTLAGGIAHDFNNILSVIMGYLDMVMDDVPKGSRLFSDLSRVHAAGERATDLVKQILALSRKGEQEKKPTLVGPIVKETLKFLRASIPSTIEINSHIEPDRGTVMAVPTQIHQIFMNLCTNAAHAMRETGGVLSVSLERVMVDSQFVAANPESKPGHYLRLTVKDTGHGITPEVMERVFEPYYTTKKQGEGTGLGLAVVHGIVTNHGGLITIESEPGNGASFQVYLPLIEDLPSAEAQAENVSLAGRERVLCVDDEPDMVDMIKGALERLGYQVVGCTSSTQALDAFTDHPDLFDMVLTDMTMPNLTGADLAAHIMAIRPDIPVILCTGFSELINEEQAKALGIREFLLKPLRKNDLAATIRQVLDGERRPEN